MKLEYTHVDVDNILAEFGAMAYSREDFSHCEHPQYLNPHVEYTEDDMVRHKMEFIGKFKKDFKLNNPELFGYLWHEEIEDWIQDRSQGDFLEDYV